MYFLLLPAAEKPGQREPHTRDGVLGDVGRHVVHGKASEARVGGPGTDDHIARQEATMCSVPAQTPWKPVHKLGARAAPLRGRPDGYVSITEREKYSRQKPPRGNEYLTMSYVPVEADFVQLCLVLPGLPGP